MKKIMHVLVLAIFFVKVPLKGYALFSNKDSMQITLSDFYASCGEYSERAQGYSKSAIAKKEFEQVLAQCKAMISEQLAPQELWIGGKQLPKVGFKPFVQKLVLSQGSQVAMWGDLHGSVHSLLRSLTKLKVEGYLDDTFKIIKPNFYMFFLGDFVDRGKYGVEVIYALLRLKLANPEQVFLVRGNHEDVDICSVYGFGDELECKFGYQESEQFFVHDIYETMPLAIFLGRSHAVEFIQCCHGGIEPGFDPRALLSSEGKNKYEMLDVLRRGDWIAMFSECMQGAIEDRFCSTDNFEPESPTSPASIGFMWHDFLDDGSQDIGYETFGRGWKFGKYLTRAYVADSWLKASTYKIRSIIRAHQHNGQMLDNLIQNKGIYSLWDGLVYTLLSAPAMGFEKFAYDSFVIVGVEDFWPIKHDCTPILS